MILQPGFYSWYGNVCSVLSGKTIITSWNTWQSLEKQCSIISILIHNRATRCSPPFWGHVSWPVPYRFCNSSPAMPCLHSWGQQCAIYLHRIVAMLLIIFTVSLEKAKVLINHHKGSIITRYIHLAGSWYPAVILVCPVSHPPKVLHSSRRRGPAALCTSPSNPVPPRSVVLAELMIASISRWVISPIHKEILPSSHGTGSSLGVACSGGSTEICKL